MKNNIHNLYTLEQLSSTDTSVHRLHPAVKLIVTLFFIVTVVSFDRYAFGRLIPYVFYPTLLMALSETPYALLFRRFLLALPFCLLAGISNLFFDQTTAMTIGGIDISFGTVSLVSIVFKTYLCVMALLILVSVTPMTQLTSAMRRLRIPNIFVLLFELTYRYIGVLADEAHSMYTAYSLRHFGRGGIDIRDMGSFIGQLLLRSFDRAERIYSAMKCRGYGEKIPAHTTKRFTTHDVSFLCVTCVLCALFRFLDVTMLLMNLFGG